MWMEDCAQCASHKADGLQAWMKHLTDMHVLPTEWPSERAAKLTGPMALRPYTTITESKKKRRKDTIPRPLNSFMLFAQHIRRNVLREFSDASNSVISQQLGDLWRTVPQLYRNRYDEEANCLVKIHQLEFPNYKYQPKKRQQQTNNTNNHNNSVRSVATGPNGVGHGSCGMILDRTNSRNTREVPPQSKISDTRRRLPSFTASTSNSLTLVDHPVDIIRTGTITDANCTNRAAIDAVLRRSIPVHQNPRLNGNCVYTENRSIPPRTSNGTHASLSSVLPPLLTFSTRQMVTSTTEMYQASSTQAAIQQDHYTIQPHGQSYDSAYASGINSSSSSSASSPAVGDLLSPNKFYSTLGSISKSPVRKKIQLIPIRPQSHQMQSTCVTTPTRQRFLSANNGSFSQSQSNGSLVINSSHSSSNSPKALADLVNLNAEPFSEVNMMENGTEHITSSEQTHQLIAPIYVRLGTDSQNFHEDVILALPPGTTIIRAVSDMAHVPTTHPARRTAFPSSGKLVTSSHPVQRGATVKLSQNGQLTRLNKITKETPHGHPDDASPQSYTTNSSSSAWSPLSGDVFLPLHQIASNRMCTEDFHDTNSIQMSCPSSATAVFCPQAESGIQFVPDSEPEGSSTDYATVPNLLDDFKMDIDLTQAPQQTNYLETTNSNLTDVVTVKVDNWSSPDVPNHQSRESFPEPTVNRPMHLAGMTEEGRVLKQSPRYSVRSDQAMDSEPPGFEFPITEEDNFDCSLDAMMNSIDITTFLPGTFPETGNIPQDDLTADMDLVETKSIGQSASSDLINSDRMLYEQDGAHIQNGYQHSVISQNNHEGLPVSTMLQFNAPNKGLRKDFSFGDMCPSVIEVLPNLQTSPLSDLDTLDKSSLIVLKREWDIGSCE